MALIRMPRAAYSRRRTLGESKHPVLGGVVNSALGTAHEAAERRAIDDRTTSLFAHLLQLELHATPFATEIDPHDAVVIFTGSVGRFCKNILHTRIVIGRIEPTKGFDHSRDHGFNLPIIGDIAADGDGLVPLGSQFIGRGTRGGLVPVGQRHRRSRFRESLRCGEA
jgi:hypothetical protein